VIAAISAMLSPTLGSATQFNGGSRCGALNVSPRIGHLHVHIDDLPWGWVEATGDNNTISVAGLPPGQHKMLVELVDANHHVFAGCAECRQTVTFTVPVGAPHQ
jgi:hypothetical protein